MKVLDGDKRTIRNALYSAAQWEDSLAEAWGEGTPERKTARARALEYRTLRNRLFPRSRNDGKLKGYRTVTLDELRKREKLVSTVNSGTPEDTAGQEEKE